jgi:phosphatidylglycerophosphatase C
MTDEQLAKRARGLALFDFDGTLIPWDTQVIFANHVIRHAPLRRLYLPFFAAFAPLYRILGDEGMKRIFLSYLWLARREEIEKWARDFVAEWIPAICHKEVLDKLRNHQESGHLTVLASASPRFYVEEVGRVLGFDVALGTEVEFGQVMPLLPDLVNHKGGEKVRRLSQMLGEPGESGWEASRAYTDSSADLPMVRACREATVVNPSSRLAALAMEKDWEIIRTTLPWRDSRHKVLRMMRFAVGI